MLRAFVYSVIVKNTVRTNPLVTVAFSHYFLWAKIPAERDLLKWCFSCSSWLQRTRVSCTCTPYFNYIFSLYSMDSLMKHMLTSLCWNCMVFFHMQDLQNSWINFSYVRFCQKLSNHSSFV